MSDLDPPPFLAGEALLDNPLQSTGWLFDDLYSVQNTVSFSEFPATMTIDDQRVTWDPNEEVPESILRKPTLNIDSICGIFAMEDDSREQDDGTIYDEVQVIHTPHGQSRA